MDGDGASGAGHGLGAGMVLDAPTWRANLHWATRLDYDAVRLAAVTTVPWRSSPTSPASLFAVVNGVIGSRGDGYVVQATMSLSEAAAYHGLQARAFAESGAAMISGITMTYTAPELGAASILAARAIGDRRTLGFLKIKRDSAFARLDTTVLSPLCAAIAITGIAAATT